MRKRDLFLIGIAVCVALALAAQLLMRNIMATGSWGLSFRQEGCYRVTSRRLSFL